MINYLNTLRLFSRDVRLYLITATLIGLTVFGGIYPALLNLYLHRLGYDLTFIGQVNGVSFLPIALFALPVGMLGGRWGPRRTMLIGLGLAITGYGSMALAELVPPVWQRGWLLLMSGVAGLGIACYIVNSNPFLMGMTGPAERQHAFSMQGALWPLAGFGGSLLGGWLPGLFGRWLGLSLDQPAPYRYPLLLAALLLIPAVLALRAAAEVNLSPPARPAEAGSAQKQPSRAGIALFGLAGLMALIGFLRLSGEGSMRTFLNIYLDAELGTSTALIGSLLP